MWRFARCAVVLAELVLTLGLALAATAQSPPPCAPLPPYVAPPGTPSLTPQQEVWLGQAIAAESAGALDGVADAKLTAELEKVLVRLTAQLPPFGYPVQVHLLLGNFPDAFDLAAGQIFITRPLISMLRNEDELAGVLAHELGHAYVRQAATDYAAGLQRGLGLSDLGSDQTTFIANYNRWVTWRERHSQKTEVDSQQIQEGADQTAFHILRAAGYDPRGLPDSFDRLVGTKGSTGNWLSDFFGTTRPDAKRLRAMLAAAAGAGAACPAARLTSDADFHQWQAALVAYQPPPDTPSLPGLVDSVKLPPLQDSLGELLFSPDGHYLLASSSSEVWVLTVRPLAIVMSIEEPAISAALFTPASDGIVLGTSDGRVERWDLASRDRTMLRQVVASDPGCEHALPSPTGSDLACARRDGVFQLLDTSTGVVRFERKDPINEVPQYGLLNGFWMVDPAFMPLSAITGLDFSPDGRYLAVKLWRYGGYVLDLSTAHLLALPGGMQSYLNPHFVFVSGTEVFGTNDPQAVEWSRVQFPSGKVEAKYHLANADIEPVTSGPYVIARPMNQSPAGVIDPVTRQVILNSPNVAVDGYGDDFAAEAKNGAIYLGHETNGKLESVAHLELPAARLSGLRLGEASSDLRLLAFSEQNRGAVWDVQKASLVATVPGFNQLWLDGAQLWLRFNPTPQQRTPKALTPMGYPGSETAFDLLHGTRHDLPAAPAGEYDVLTGPITLVWYPGGKLSRSQLPLEARDTTTGQVLWSRTFDLPNSFPLLQVLPDGRQILLAFTLKSSDAENAPAVRAVQDRQAATWLEVLDARTGKLENSLLLNPAPSLDLAPAFVLDGHLYLGDGANRMLAYDLVSGKLLGVWDGRALENIASRHVWLAKTAPRTLAIFPGGAAQPVQEYKFPEDVVFTQASADGDRVLVVTRDETAYILNLPSKPGV